MKTNLHFSAVIAALFFVLPSCMLVGPDHSVPSTEGAESYKSGSSSFPSRMDKRWWRAFGDSGLNSLMSDLEKGNLDLRAAEARRNQAYSALGIDRSQLAPQVLSEASASRNRQSQNGLAAGFGPTYYNNYSVAMSLGYELDLWGRVRRLVEAGNASADAAEISVDQVKLSLQAQLARSYFAMRFIDSEAEVLGRALETRKETLELAKERFEGGKTSELDVARAEAELATTRAQLVALEAPRASLENAIAVLAGKNASNFSIAPKSVEGNPPGISAGSPAQLLGRRPDVWVAERNLAATSARIGIAKAAFYPKVSLIGTGGLSSINTSNFLKFSSSEFSVGPQVDLPLFQGLRRKADYELAKSQHEEALANYQQAVLVAFADVENALSARRSANKEIDAQRDSVIASQKSFDLSNARYKEGISSSLEVVDSQRELLNARRAEVQSRGRAFEATVLLMQALGGGFSK
ncbi:MAG: efflux transporter outer membrane subunit [Akkermansiaceae bacterium]|nr:efflux transporter outer membrane subunit [Akkermansiaceae bacterium]MDP4646213.1 efflux transporter outer membrane subunit [Akkermansiaceae bacterium]MDP4720851.1 efflux transporter outer membrane subunit [Akkermansiaceae bacterium]MDP4780394.1 efflux transporter outer membrane subunit [Akkermansiaceae bacterium]MDP4846695.1 efflux transporter outer membrane subunit [Akkermansiaceae bacterium]